MPKQVRVTIVSSIEENGDVFHELTFADGHKDVVHIPHTSPLRNRFVEAGSKAKLLAAANAGKDAADSAAKVKAIADAFKAGKWSLVPEGDGQPKVGILAQALAALKPCSLDEAQSYVATLTKAQQAKLRASPRVAAQIVSINAAKEPTDDGLDDFLSPADDAVTEAYA